MITYLFMFNSINFYLPTLIVAVLSKYFEFMDVYLNILIQMVFNQFIANFWETYTPRWAAEKKLKQLDEDFEECLVEGAIPKKKVFIKEDESSSDEDDSQLVFQKIDDKLSYEIKVEVEKSDNGVWNYVKKDQAISVMKRHYQALRDYCLFSKTESVMENYMELVIQFGYVILFGQIFPLGAFFSYFSNEIQIKSQVDNMKYMRRPKPEVADDIGNWMGAIEILS